MLHITKKSTTHHKKAFAAEVFVSLAMLAVFFTSASQASDITVDTVISLVNSARKAAHVAILRKNSLLQEAAEKKAQDMIDNNYFAHVSPQGKSPWYWITQDGYDYHYAGENLAVNFTNAEQEQQAWMDSPLHKKNILNADYQEIGVGVKQGVIDGHNAIVVVQMFGTAMQPLPVAAADSQQELSEASVAGVQSTNSEASEILSGKVSPEAIFNKYSGNINGWLTALGVIISLVIVDIVAAVHRKNGQMVTAQGIRNRHA